MKVKVLIEYEFPDIDSLMDEQRLSIETGVSMAVPGVFGIGEDDAIIARCWSVEAIK